jgi:hypothetical protein
MGITNKRAAEMEDDLSCIIDKERWDISQWAGAVPLWYWDSLYTNWDTLVNFFSTLNLTESQYMLSIIFKQCSIDLFRLVFYFSYKLWKIDSFLSTYSHGGFSFSKHDLDYLSWITDEILQNLSNSQIKQLIAIFTRSNYSPQLYQLKSEINWKLINIRFTKLSSQLQWINIEINRDREDLRKTIQYLGFHPQYDQFLTELDAHFFGEKASIQVASLIWSFREFSSSLIIDIAKKISEIEELPNIPKSPKANSPIWHARYYIKEKLWLSNHEDDFLDNFVQILQTQWWHAFLSSMEYFRLAKNIFIEIMLFLISRFRDFQAKPAE